MMTVSTSGYMALQREPVFVDTVDYGDGPVKYGLSRWLLNQSEMQAILRYRKEQMDIITELSFENARLKKHARLIAAAPDLLEALKDAVSAIERIDFELLGRDQHTGYYYRDELLAKCDTAIAKAEDSDE